MIAIPPTGRRSSFNGGGARRLRLLFSTRILEITWYGGGGIEQAERFFERSCRAFPSAEICRFGISGADPGRRADTDDVSLTVRLE